MRVYVRICVCLHLIPSSLCTFNNSYAPVIAPFLADLNPSESFLSQITVSLQLDPAVVSYNRIPLFEGFLYIKYNTHNGT